jgi:hypothetical protein
MLVEIYRRSLTSTYFTRLAYKTLVDIDNTYLKYFRELL